MKKRMALISLLLIAVFSLTTVASAAVFSSAYISDYFAKLTRTSGDNITVSFDIAGKDTMNVIGAKTIIVQEKAPGSTQWVAVATITSDVYSSMLGYNTRTHGSYVSYSGAKSGYSYRAKVYFYAEKGGYDTREYITTSI